MPSPRSSLAPVKGFIFTSSPALARRVPSASQSATDMKSCPARGIHAPERGAIPTGRSRRSGRSNMAASCARRCSAASMRRTSTGESDMRAPEVVHRPRRPASTQSSTAREGFGGVGFCFGLYAVRAVRLSACAAFHASTFRRAVSMPRRMSASLPVTPCARASVITSSADRPAATAQKVRLFNPSHVAPGWKVARAARYRSVAPRLNDSFSIVLPLS